MSKPMTFDVENYFHEFADASSMEEAARFKTFPSGNYMLNFTKQEGRYFEDAGGWWKAAFGDGDVDPDWRKGIRLSATVSDPQHDNKKVGFVNVEASWVEKRDKKTGNFDKLFVRWEQLTRVLFSGLSAKERAAKEVGEVLGAAMQYPVGAYIIESFQVPAIDGSSKWTTPKSEEETRTYKLAGYKAANFVISLNKVK